MDPQATLRFIEDNMVNDVPENQPEDVIDALLDLRVWIARGGFHPNWTIQQDAVDLYRAFFNLTNPADWRAYRRGE